MGMNIDELYEEAKRKHWGIYCAEWATCEKDGECSKDCPFGGVSEKENEKEKD